MERLFKKHVIVILLFGTAIYLPSCMKEATLPVVKTTIVSDITQTTALVKGNVTDDGGAKIIYTGFCWSTSPNPTTSSNKTSDVTGISSFNSSITGLTPNTKYYVRAYATNSAGTGYGNEVTFTTNDIVKAAAIPTVTTSVINSITWKSAISGGTIIDDGGEAVLSKGVVWSTDQYPTIEGSRSTDGDGSGSFTSNLTGLNPGITYFVRAYAINSAGVGYGNQFFFATSYGPGEAIRKADFPGGPKYSAVSFSIGTKVYLGLGNNDGDNGTNDFWEWDLTTNVWTKKADFPENSTDGSVGFSIGTKGYIGTGHYISTYSSRYDFWEYDPAANTWTQKASLPGSPAREVAVGFSIGTKGYIGTGRDIFSTHYYNDFWEWDQATNVWTKKADFAGIARAAAVGFSIGNKGYIGTGGGDGAPYPKDFWEWDQATDVWTKKADFAGIAREGAVGFSIGNKGYIGTGFNRNNISTPLNLKDIWEWDQMTDVWTRKADLNGDARDSAIGVSIGNRGYIGTGLGGITNYLQDFWEYDPNNQ